MEETNKPILPYQSNFARQLHENEVMQRRNQVATQNRIQSQMEIAYNEPQQAISHTPQQAISHTPQQDLQHALQPNIIYVHKHIQYNMLNLV